ncbi:MAG TPA: hypothetical protein VLB50_08205 [Ignavibacteriaceae bacterium]|nr:hypothetical protein [Ignavibacteriaceae bacterium]
MKRILFLFLIIVLFAAGCENNQNSQIKNSNEDVKSADLTGSLDAKSDSLEKGDIFVTTGPAGRTEHKEGRIVMFTDSGKTMPIKMVDSVLLAMSNSDSTLYRVKKNGNQTILVFPDHDQILRDGRMMFITDTGEKMEVKFFGNKMVVITKENNMLPLEKQE